MEKTIVASVVGLTQRKKELLDFEYSNYQWWMLFGIDRGLLSSFKASKGYKQERITYKDYPLPIESRFIKDWFRERETKLTKHWIKIPNSKKKGVGLWLGSGAVASAQKPLARKGEEASTQPVPMP